MNETQPWHLDKRIPIALILALIGQTFGMGWWASSISERVASLEQSKVEARALAIDIAVIRANVESIKDVVRRLERQIDGRPGASPGNYIRPDEFKQTR